jgi:outer membrane immunogenic protein
VAVTPLRRIHHKPRLSDIPVPWSLARLRRSVIAFGKVPARELGSEGRMNRLPSLLLSVVMAAITPIAQAADLQRPVYKALPMRVAPAYSWGGLYIGAHAGWGFARNRFHDTVSGTDAADFFADGVLAGGQLGYNWQSGAWVFGIEGEGSFAHIRKGVFGGFCGGFQNFGCVPGFGGCGGFQNFGCVPGCGGFQNFGCFGQLGARIEETALLTGRIGHAWGPWLAYAKGGLAYAHERYVFNTPGVLDTIVDRNRWGWTVGGGVEYGFAANWSAKLEYNFIDFGTERLSFVAPAGVFAFDHAQQVHLAKLGINYRFAPDVVVARY